jgi:hypothetical protein
MIDEVVPAKTVIQLLIINRLVRAPRGGYFRYKERSGGLFLAEEDRGSLIDGKINYVADSLKFINHVNKNRGTHYPGS